MTTSDAAPQVPGSGACIRALTPELTALSGSPRWATAMVARRPFLGEKDLLRAGAQVLDSLTDAELRDAANTLHLTADAAPGIREELAARTDTGLRELHAQNVL